jgi:hypothetical protein
MFSSACPRGIPAAGGVDEHSGEIPEPSLIDEDRKRVGTVEWLPSAKAADGRKLAGKSRVASLVL